MAPVTKKISGKTCSSQPWGNGGGNRSMTLLRSPHGFSVVLSAPNGPNYAVETGSSNKTLFVYVTSRIDILLAACVQILVQVPPLRRCQAALPDVIERLVAIGIVEPLEVEQRHVLAAKPTVQIAVLPAGAGHVEYRSGQPREQGVLAERRCREHGIRARGRHEGCAGYRLVRGMPAQKFNIRGV